MGNVDILADAAAFATGHGRTNDRAPSLHHLYRGSGRATTHMLTLGIQVRRAAVALLLATGSCSDATDPDAAAQFAFRDPAMNTVVQLQISNSQGLQQAGALLQSGVAMWAIGTPKRGNGGFNGSWTWHIDPATVTFAEVTIEACQVAASMLADDLDYWIDFGQVCIWGVVESRSR